MNPALGLPAADYEFAAAAVLVTSDALASGGVPDALSDAQQDWYFWHAWRGELANTGQLNYNFSFDIHSARKLREGYRLVWVTENPAVELLADLNVRLRTLWRL